MRGMIERYPVQTVQAAQVVRKTGAQDRAPAPSAPMAGRQLGRLSQTAATVAVVPAVPAQTATPAQAAVSGATTSSATAGCGGEASFHLDLVDAAGLDVETVPHLFRRLTLAPNTNARPGSQASVGVGRQQQQPFFDLWLPDLENRNCVSRRAFEICWTVGTDRAWLVASSSNPLHVDNKVVQNKMQVPLLDGSIIAFAYDHRMLLRLRFVITPISAQPSAAAAVASAQPSCSSPLWSVDRTQQLAGENLEDRFLGVVTLLDKVASVADAVERLNSGQLVCNNSYCVVYSATKGSYFLLHQCGMKEVALSRLGFVQEGNDESAEPIAAAKVLPRRDLQMLEPQPEVQRAVTSGCWKLLCTRASNQSSLASLPPELREIQLGEGCNYFGPHHQQKQLEAWLPDSNRFSISRTHIKFTVSGGSLTMSNMSGNGTILLCVDAAPLQPSAELTLKTGQIVSLARNENGTTIHFLTLQVQWAELLAVMRNPLDADRFRRPATVGDLRVTEVARVASTPAVPPPSLRMDTTCAISAADTTIVGSSVAVRATPSQPAAAASMVRRMTSAGAGYNNMLRIPEEVVQVAEAAMTQGACLQAESADAPVIVLELWGEAVLDVPLWQRRIGPLVMDPRTQLIVGPRHQPDLHKRALAEDCCDTLDGQDFAVNYINGELWLCAMSSKRIWHSRSNESAIAMARGDPTAHERVKLMPGDHIVLNTGNTEGARRRLCWRFRRAEVDRLQDAQAASVAATADPWWLSSRAPPTKLDLHA